MDEKAELYGNPWALIFHRKEALAVPSALDSYGSMIALVIDFVH